MNTSSGEPTYRFWGADNTIHGPVNLPGLADLVQSKHVNRGTWVFFEPERSWAQAADMPQLNLFFGSPAKASPDPVQQARAMGVTTEVLRRIKILAQMDENQLDRFLEFVEVVAVDRRGLIVREGSRGDTMYLVLEGGLRARVMVDNEETVLVTFAAGDFFGEVSLLDQGPRSADIVANEQCLLLKITEQAFQRMKKEAPDVALPFLYNVSRSVVTRMRMLNKRYEDSVHLWHLYAGK